MDGWMDVGFERWRNDVFLCASLSRSELLVRATVAEEQLKQLQKHLKELGWLAYSMGMSIGTIWHSLLVDFCTLAKSTGDDRRLSDADSEPQAEI